MRTDVVHTTPRSLNEVQFPKELQQGRSACGQGDRGASMKCSSRRNCNGRGSGRHTAPLWASMKCSSRRNCNRGSAARRTEPREPQ